MELKIKIKPIATVKKTLTTPIINKNVKAKIILKDNSKDEYWAIIDNKNYSITSRSFENKDKTIIYSRYKDEHGQYIKIIRSGLDINNPMPINHYIPFKPELEVTGDLIIREGQTLFDINYGK